MTCLTALSTQRLDAPLAYPRGFCPLGFDDRFQDLHRGFNLAVNDKVIIMDYSLDFTSGIGQPPADDLLIVGAAPGQIRLLFFGEAVLLSSIGAAAGVVLGLAGNAAIVRVYPILPVATPAWAVAAAVVTAVTTGIVFSIMPARRAARLDPVSALSGR
jgi:hypothetical protein